MLDVHCDNDSQGVNWGEMGRSLVSTGRIATLTPIGYKRDEINPPKTVLQTCGRLREGLSAQATMQAVQQEDNNSEVNEFLYGSIGWTRLHRISGRVMLEGCRKRVRVRSRVWVRVRARPSLQPQMPANRQIDMPRLAKIGLLNLVLVVVTFDL